MKKIYYKGKGEHSVATLEAIIEQREEEIRQLRLVCQNQMTVEQAKEVLENAGYFVENLWHVDDVKSKCNEKVQDNTALQILQDNMNDGWIISNINDGIESSLEARGYPLKGEGD